MNKRNILSVALIVVSIGLAVLGYFVLPEQVVIQLSIGASGNSTVPKLIALLIPTALGTGGAATTLLSNHEGNTTGKGILLSAVGIGLVIIMIAVNSFMK